VDGNVFEKEHCGTSRDRSLRRTNSFLVHLAVGQIVVPGLLGGWVLQSVWTSVLVAAIQGLQAPTPLVALSGIGLMAIAAAIAAMVPLRRALAADSSVLMR
jgi:hypothetical protein